MSVLNDHSLPEGFDKKPDPQKSLHDKIDSILSHLHLIKKHLGVSEESKEPVNESKTGTEQSTESGLQPST